MNDFNNILKHSELNIKDHKQLIHLINALIMENRKMFESLPYGVQQQLGFDMYRMKLFKFEQVDDVFAKSLFSPFELGKQVALLVDAFKNLLMSNISLQVHHKVLDAREEQALKEKVSLVKVTFSSGSSGSPLFKKTSKKAKKVPVTYLGGVYFKPNTTDYDNQITTFLQDRTSGGGTVADVYNELDALLQFIFTNWSVYNKGKPVKAPFTTYQDFPFDRKLIADLKSNSTTDPNLLASLEYLEKLVQIIVYVRLIDEQRLVPKYTFTFAKPLSSITLFEKWKELIKSSDRILKKDDLGLKADGDYIYDLFNPLGLTLTSVTIRKPSKAVAGPVYTAVDPNWWIDATAASSATPGPGIKGQFKDHLNNSIPDASKKLSDAYGRLESALKILFINSVIIMTYTGIDLAALGSSDNIKVSDLDQIYTNNTTNKTTNEKIDVGGSLSLYDALKYLIDYIRILIRTILATVNYNSTNIKRSTANNWNGILNSLTGLNTKSSDTAMNNGFNKVDSAIGILEKFNKLQRLPTPYNMSTDTTTSVVQLTVSPNTLTGGSNINFNIDSDSSIDPYYEKYMKYKAKYQQLKKELKL